MADLPSTDPPSFSYSSPTFVLVEVMYERDLGCYFKWKFNSTEINYNSYEAFVS